MTSSSVSQYRRVTCFTSCALWKRLVRSCEKMVLPFCFYKNVLPTHHAHIFCSLIKSRLRASSASGCYRSLSTPSFALWDPDSYVEMTRVTSAVPWRHRCARLSLCSVSCIWLRLELSSVASGSSKILRYLLRSIKIYRIRSSRHFAVVYQS